MPGCQLVCKLLFNIRNSYILRLKLPKTPIFLAKILLYSSYILGKTWLTACEINVRVAPSLRVSRPVPFRSGQPFLKPNSIQILYLDGKVHLTKNKFVQEITNFFIM